MNFIDRKKEIEALNKEYKKENSFVILYGRRRVGKTTLIREFIKDKRAFYFFADKQNENLQIERFKNQISEQFKDEFLKKIEIKDWDTLFDYLLTKILVQSIDNYFYQKYYFQYYIKLIYFCLNLKYI